MKLFPPLPKPHLAEAPALRTVTEDGLPAVCLYDPADDAQPPYILDRLSAFPAVQLAEHLVRISDPVICKQNPAEPFFFPQAEPDHRGVRLLAVP